MDDTELNNLHVLIEYHNHRICTPLWHIADHIMPCVDITYIIKGSAEYTLNDKKYIVSSGSILCVQKGYRRSAVTFPDDLMECYCVCGPVVDSNMRDTQIPLPLISYIGIQHDIINMFHNLNSEWLMREPGYMLKARAIYMMIIQRIFRLLNYFEKETDFDKRIQKAIKHITEHFKERLTVRDLAEIVGLNTQYFGYLFKNETGQSFHQYLTAIRLNCAENMLKNGEYSVYETAEACGFSDIYYFSKVFKENRGYTPSQVIYSSE